MSDDSSLITQLQQAHHTALVCLDLGSIYKVGFCNPSQTSLQPFETGQELFPSLRQIRDPIQFCLENPGCDSRSLAEACKPLAYLCEELDNAVAEAHRCFSPAVRGLIIAATGGDKVPPTSEVATFHELAVCWAQVGVLAANARRDAINFDDLQETVDDAQAKTDRAFALNGHFTRGFFADGIKNERVLKLRVESELITSLKFLRDNPHCLDVVTTEHLGVTIKADAFKRVHAELMRTNEENAIPAPVVTDAKSRWTWQNLAETADELYPHWLTPKVSLSNDEICNICEVYRERREAQSIGSPEWMWPDLGEETIEEERKKVNHARREARSRVANKTWQPRRSKRRSCDTK